LIPTHSHGAAIQAQQKKMKNLSVPRNKKEGNLLFF
jgi:hypothetical protein